MADDTGLVWKALADPTRRAILHRLAAGDASVTELAAPFQMSQPAISKHLKVLEKAGLISRGRDAQRRPCRLEARPLRDATAWLPPNGAFRCEFIVRQIDVKAAYRLWLSKNEKRAMEDVLAQTMAIAERCNFKLNKVKNPFPEFPLPDGYTLDSYFEHVAREGFARRWESLGLLEAAGRLKKSRSDYEQRLTRELAIIQQMKFSGYFLIVWDFIRYARENSIPVGPGRGSAAGGPVDRCREGRPPARGAPPRRRGAALRPRPARRPRAGPRAARLDRDRQTL